MELNNSFHVENFVDNGAKTLRQLQEEDDDEERFQADLKKAVDQSLGICHFNCYLFIFLSCLYFSDMIYILSQIHTPISLYKNKVPFLKW